MSAFEDVHKPLPTTSSPLPSNPFLTSSPIRTNPTNEGDDQARFEGLISPPLFPSPPRTAMPAVDLRSASFDALHTTSSSSSKPSVPLLTELQTAQTTLIASLCHQLQESTMSHYHNTVQSLTEMYEDRLLHQQQHYTSIITSLTQQIQSLTQQSTQQQSVQEQLQQQLDTRTLKMSTFLHEKHVNMYSKPFFSLQRIFTTWKQDYKRNKRCRKVEQFIIRIDRKVCLQKYFQQLQSFVEENRQEKYLTEMKFKYETLSNEVSSLCCCYLYYI